MNKKFHAGLLSVLVCAAIGSLASCTKDYGEDISQLQSEVSALQSTVNTLQSQITAGSVITAVTPTTNGVTVTLSNGKTFTLTNGADGAKGDKGDQGIQGPAGTPGSVVTIGTDGYWYIDGKKTEYPAQGPKGDKGDTGAKGDKGDTGATGAPGADGAKGDKGDKGDTGAAGKDGDTIYYYPDCANNVWVKVTNGAEEATTMPVYVPGTVTAVWDTENGSLTLNNVQGAEGPIVITLPAALKSIALIPESLYEGVGLIKFHNLYGNDGKFITSLPASASYRLNPAGADGAAYDWVMINRTVETITAKAAGDATDLVEATLVDVKDGAANFALTLKKEVKPLTANGTNDIVAMQTTADGEVITSDYAYIVNDSIKGLSIIHADKLEAEKSCLDTVRYYRTAPVTITDPADTAITVLKTPYLVYNSTLDLNEYVETYVESEDTLLKALGLTPSYTFQLANEQGEKGDDVIYLGQDQRTDQNEFVTLTAGVMEVDHNFLPGDGRAAINRTPLVYVESKLGNTVLASAYIKVVIVDTVAIPVVDPVEPDPTPTPRNYVKLIEHAVDFCYDSLSTEFVSSCPDFTADSLKVTWDEFNKAVLDNAAVNMSMDEFKTKYDAAHPLYIVELKDSLYYLEPNQLKADDYVDFDTEKPAGTQLVVTSPSEWMTSTSILSLGVNNAVQQDTTFKVYIVYPALDNEANPDVVVEFGVTVDEKTPEPPHVHNWNAIWKDGYLDNMLNHDYILGTQNYPVEEYDEPGDPFNVTGGVRVKGKRINDAWVPSSAVLEHFEDYKFVVPEGSEYTFTIVRDADKADFGFTRDSGTSYADTIKLAAGTYDITNDIAADIRYKGANLASTKNVLVEITDSVLACGCTRKAYYYVVFESLFKLEIADATLKTLKSQADTVDVKSLITVTDGTAAIFTYDAEADAFVATDYAKTNYNFADTDLVVTLDKLVYDATGVDAESTFGGCLNILAQSTQIEWDNMGTDLQNDKKAKFEITVKIADTYTVTDKGTVTVLSTENSK